MRNWLENYMSGRKRSWRRGTDCRKHQRTLNLNSKIGGMYKAPTLALVLMRVPAFINFGSQRTYHLYDGVQELVFYIVTLFFPRLMRGKDDVAIAISPFCFTGLQPYLEVECGARLNSEN